MRAHRTIIIGAVNLLAVTLRHVSCQNKIHKFNVNYCFDAVTPNVRVMHIGSVVV